MVGDDQVNDGFTGTFDIGTSAEVTALDQASPFGIGF
jgi:hypothetical protein